MNRFPIGLLVAAALLSGCTGGKHKLPVCTKGKFRFANASGSILPTLPIAGQAAPPNDPAVRGTAPLAVPAVPSPADPAPSSGAPSSPGC